MSGDEKITSPIKAIKQFCFECCGRSNWEVKQCPACNCQLHEFRLGKNPYLKRTLTEEQRAEYSQRAKELVLRRKQAKEGKE